MMKKAACRLLYFVIPAPRAAWVAGICGNFCRECLTFVIPVLGRPHTLVVPTASTPVIPILRLFPTLVIPVFWRSQKDRDLQCKKQECSHKLQEAPRHFQSQKGMYTK